MSDVRILASGLGFPEGPVAMADGSVILTEIRNGRCSRVTADGKVSVFSANGGGPNGLAVGPDGALYCCNNGGSRYVEGKSMGQGPHPDYKFGWIERLDPKTGKATVLYTECDGHRLSAPNDLVFDTAGGFYFTDLGSAMPAIATMAASTMRGRTARRSSASSIRSSAPMAAAFPRTARCSTSPTP